MPALGNELPEDAITAIIDHIESRPVEGGIGFGQLGGPPTEADDSAEDQ